MEALRAEAYMSNSLLLRKRVGCVFGGGGGSDQCEWSISLQITGAATSITQAISNRHRLKQREGQRRYMDGLVIQCINASIYAEILK